jgi:8-oxo-dGTP pyrophosphatase MutT (NUDIX family)
LSFTQKLALWADKLRAISAFGIKKCVTEYDKERYQAVQNISMEMFSSVTEQTIEELEPLRETLFSHTAPHVISGCAIINQNNEILLIKRASNEKWAMPSGNIELGESPLESALREAREETGILVKSKSLIGIYDTLKNKVPSALQRYFILFLCEPVEPNIALPESTDPNEVLELAWFSQNNIPKNLSPGNEEQIVHSYLMHYGNQKSYFDQ